MLCYVMLCYVMLCYVMLCYVVIAIWGCIFSQARNELGASSFLARDKFLYDFPLYLMPSWKQVRSQVY